MAREEGGINFPNNFEVQKAAPIDARLACETLTDLYALRYTHIGMIVSVTGETNEEDNGVYVMQNQIAPDVDSQLSDWEKIGSSSSESESSNNIILASASLTTYYVSNGGDDSTGEKGNINKTFKNIIAARDAAIADGNDTNNIIYVMSGTYTENNLNTGYSGSFHFESGSVLDANNNIIVSAAQGEEFNVFGNGKFINGEINLSNNGKGYFECYSLDVGSKQQGIYMENDSYLLIQGKNWTSASTAYLCTMRSNSKLVANFDNIDYTGSGIWAFAFYIQSGALGKRTGSVTLNCLEFHLRQGNGFCWFGNQEENQDNFNIQNLYVYSHSKQYPGVFLTNSSTVTNVSFRFKGNIISDGIQLFNTLGSGGGTKDWIFEGTLKTKNIANPINLAGIKSGSKITWDMWMETEDATTSIKCGGGDVYFNKSLYTSGVGIEATGGEIIIDSFKIVNTDSNSVANSIEASSVSDIVINHSLSTNRNISSNITNIGPGSLLYNNNVK